MPVHVEPLHDAPSLEAYLPVRVLSAAALALSRLGRRRPVALAVSHDWLRDHVHRAGKGQADS